jgi:NCAIR mutase (PurE)-related protein
LREVLEKLSRGQISVAQAEEMLRVLAVEEIGNLARLDISREFRKGIPEIVIAEGKAPEVLVRIVLAALTGQGRAIVSRPNGPHVEAVKKAVPRGATLEGDEAAGILVIKSRDFIARRTGGKVGILGAGTSDIPIAEEARVVAEEMGCEVTTAYDVGVAGIHRLSLPLKGMVAKDVDTIVVVAGREGALPSVVAGLVDVPVIGVPASFGYGFGAKGVSALMAMLQACPLGLAVVNIDGGVPAGTMAALIANRAAKFRTSRKKRNTPANQI